MNDARPPRGRTHAALALAAVAVVLLSGCLGASGVSNDFSLYPNDAAAQSDANVTAATTESVEDSGGTAPETATSAGADAATPDAADAEPAATTSTGSTPDEGPATTEAPPPSETASDTGSSAGGGGSGGSSAAAGSSDQSTTTASPTPAPTTGTPASDRSDACDAYDEQVGPHDRAELSSDDEVCITSWDDRPYPDSFVVSGVVGNPSGETIDDVNVEVTLYGPDGSVLAQKTDGMNDVGESGRFLVSFDDVFAGPDAPEPDGPLNYRIHATVGSTSSPSTAANPPTTTSPTTTAAPGTETDSAAGTESTPETDQPTETDPTTEAGTTSPGEESLTIPEGCEPTYAVDPVETRDVETVGVRDGQWTVAFGEVHNYWAYDVIDGGDVVLEVTLQGEDGETIATKQANVGDLRGVNGTQFAVAFDVEADRVDDAYATWTVERQRWIDTLCSDDGVTADQGG